MPLHPTLLNEIQSKRINTPDSFLGVWEQKQGRFNFTTEPECHRLIKNHFAENKGKKVIYFLSLAKNICSPLTIACSILVTAKAAYTRVGSCSN